jgi:hypothetical protein
MSLAGRPSEIQKRIGKLVTVASEHIVPGSGGLYYQQVKHDDHCSSIRTQSMGDCICDPVIPPPVEVRAMDEWMDHACRNSEVTS